MLIVQRVIAKNNKMHSHRYILQPYKGLNTRYHCPECNHRDKTFVRYIDTEANQQIHDDVGRCNREVNCGYHYSPKQYFEKNNTQFQKTNYKSPIPNSQSPIPNSKSPILISFINQDTFKKTLSNYHCNNFVQFLINQFGNSITQQILNTYFIGTSKHWQGANIFWQIDTKGKIHTGKIMLYNTSTGKRIKEPSNYISWVHKLINQPEYNLKQCFFGEHLIKNNNKPIAIVESEKTAIIASVYLPQFIWLAVGSLSNLNAEKCKVLKNRKCVLFPDLNAFEKWSIKAQQLNHITNFQVSDLLETKASDDERKQGLDLADYLLKCNLFEFLYPEYKTALNSFDEWLINNPNGGIFKFDNQVFKVNVKK